MRALILLSVFSLSCSVVPAQTQPRASYEKSGTGGNAGYDHGPLQLQVESKPCTQARARAYSNGLTARLKPSAVTLARQMARSSFTQSLSRPSASAAAWLSQLRRDVESNVKTGDVDFSQMSVEDAVMLMFTLISEDAEKDLKEMLKDMKEGARKREALREKAAEMRGYICRFIDQREKASNGVGRPD